LHSPQAVRVWLATGHTDMRKGFPSLALQVQEVLRRDPLGGHLFCFRGRRGDLLKVIGTTARGHACSRSGWSAGASCGRRRPTAWVTISAAQLGYLSPGSIGDIRRKLGARPRSG